MTLEQLKSHLPGWIKVDSIKQSENSVYYLTGNVRVGAYGPDPWISATSLFRVSFMGDHRDAPKFKFISEVLWDKTEAIITHVDELKNRVNKFTPDTQFGKLVIKDIFNNPDHYRD